MNTTTLIQSEHELTSHVSFGRSHHQFIFVRCQSILIHLSSLLCDLFVHMNSEWDFKRGVEICCPGNTTSAFVSAFLCSDSTWGIFSLWFPSKSMTWGYPIIYSHNPSPNVENRCLGYYNNTRTWDLKGPEAMSLLRCTRLCLPGLLSVLMGTHRQATVQVQLESESQGVNTTWNLNVATVTVGRSEPSGEIQSLL